MSALITSLYTTLDNKDKLVENADKIYRDHTFVNVEDDKNYGLDYINSQEMEKLFGQIGKFDKYTNLSLLEEIRTDLFGE